MRLKFSSPPSTHFSTDSSLWPSRLAKGGDDFVAVELPGVALFEPGLARRLLEGRVENLELALLVEMALHVGDVRVVAAVALLLVQDLEEDLQQRVSPVGDDRPCCRC